MTQEEKTMLKYARDVFQGTQQVEDISYSYRQEIASFLNTLGLEQEPPQGLDEVAADYAKRGYSTNADPFDEIREYQLEKDAFKAGAEWMAEQGVSVDGEFGIRGVETESIVNELLDGGFKMGDKVII